MVTPFTASGEIDPRAVERIVDYILDAGAAPFVLGTTGEDASIPGSMRPGLVKAVVERAARRAPVYAGVSSNCVQESVEAAELYSDFGVDAVVAHLPSYYPLNPDQMFRYYEALAERLPVPLVAYNIPMTTHMSIPLEVMERLSRHPNIIGFKDSENNEARVEQAANMWRERTDFSYLCGSGSLYAEALLRGAHGLVVASGNVIPRMYQDLYQTALRGDSPAVYRIWDETVRISAVYQEGRILSQTLAALKVMMNVMGLCGETVLPPLCPISSEEKAEIKRRMVELGLVGV
jgi:4-hydroxy-tetrahydrodipicolinate synthase